ncbi:hypothetical protein M422DRAFT_51434 [Sphaerobolus stellatus SS14]|uniref:Uncharacterized protein n=1 Tax=Sphaerobolus stellatus (strain SS14) TaxID=990650 RepID=A0A0C9VDQ1_SPHS4|nr:hypothetical protein M422DRAFT_51434 [Sphaerobolus stellatus SS14]
MGRRKRAVEARLKNLGQHAQKLIRSDREESEDTHIEVISMPEQFEPDGVGDDSNFMFLTGSINSSKSLEGLSSLGSEMDLDDIEIQNEAKFDKFPLQENTKALHAAGYPDIRMIWRKTQPASPASVISVSSSSSLEIIGVASKPVVMEEEVEVVEVEEEEEEEELAQPHRQVLCVWDQ